ncbi:ATP-dependent protease domain protein [Rhodobacter sp. AKP1]|nr:ATP-dependent protease domain protein [Rhodobacter sp. AKP1]
MTASFPIGGSDFQWNSSHPGEAVRLIHESGVANPCVIFDEVEKDRRAPQGAILAWRSCLSCSLRPRRDIAAPTFRLRSI